MKLYTWLIAKLQHNIMILKPRAIILIYNLAIDPIMHVHYFISHTLEASYSHTIQCRRIIIVDSG